MWQRFNRGWVVFSELYAPAIVGGLFLCIADLFQSGSNGQIGKLGRVIGSPLRLQLENELIGFFVILLLGWLLCWVFRPANRGDSFSKGASVFAVLAALVPAGVTPGGLSSSAPLRTTPAEGGAMSIIGSARAQTVIPLVPAGRLVVRIVGGEGVANDEIQASIRKDGVSVSLLDPGSSQRIGFERIMASRFEIVRPPRRYLMELEIDGFERVRGEIEISTDTKVVDVTVKRRTAIPQGIQRLMTAAPLVIAQNERETLIERGKDATRRGQFKAGLDLYDKALAMNAKDKEALNFKGYALFRLARYEDAYKALSASRQVDRDYFLARLNFAKAACRLGRTKEASDALIGGGTPLTQRQAQVVLEDGEFLQSCHSASQTMKTLASMK